MSQRPMEEVSIPSKKNKNDTKNRVQPIEPGKYPFEIMEKFKEGTGSFVTKSKSTVKGAVIGLGGGYVIARIFSLPTGLTMISGIITGVVFADIINNYSNKIIKCYKDVTNNNNVQPEQNS